MSEPGREEPHPSVLETVRPKLEVSPRLRLKDEVSVDQPSPVLKPAMTDLGACVPAGRGHYKLLGEIARGGMGAVIKGHDTDLGRDVALKVLHDGLANDPVWLQRFVEEAQIGGQLQHPGIVPVYELGLMADERPYFTMKLVKGRTLSALLAERTGLRDDRRRFLSIFEDICQTMAYAHSRGVIHRDLKPSNVMVGAFGEVQLVDWGLAKVMNTTRLSARRPADPVEDVSIIATVRSGSSMADSASVAGSVMGTPAYMSPEQARGEVEDLDERTDVFSLGAILLQVLTGEPPVPASKRSVLAAGARPTPEELRARLDRAGADEGLAVLVLDCLASDRVQRPRNAGEVARRIGDYLASTEERARAAQIEAAEARVKAAEERRARRLTLGLAASVVVSLLLVGGGWAWVERERGQRRDLMEERVSAALSDASFARGRSDWKQARASLELARAHYQSGVPDAGLEARLSEETAILSRAESRAQFLRDVEQVRSVVGRTDDRKLGAYAAAFERQGISVGVEGDGAVAEMIRKSGMAEDMARALVDWARLLRQSEGKSTDEVRRLLQLSLSVDDDPGRSRMRRALLAEDLGEIRRIATSPEAASFSPMTTIVLSDALYAQDNAELATQLLETAELHHPGDFHLLIKLGVRHMNRGEFEDAIPYIKAALSAEPENSWTLANLGSLYREQGDLQRAAVYGRRGVEVGAENAQAHNYFGRTLEASGDLDGAIEMYQRAVALEPEYHYALLRLADLLELQDRYAEASDCYRSVLSFDPDNTSALNGLAWNLVTAADPQERDPDEALFLAERALELEQDPTHLNTVGLCFYRLGMLTECTETLAEARRLRGAGSPYDSFVLAMAAHGLGDETAARARYEEGTGWMRTHELDPSDASLLPRLRAEAAEVLGLGDEAD